MISVLLPPHLPGRGVQDGKIAASELGLLMRSLGRAPTEQEVKDYTHEIAGSGSFNFDGLKR